MNALTRTLAAGAAGLAFGLAAPAAQAQTAEWKFSHWLPPTHSLHPILVGWARGIEKDSGGALKISVFPAQQLGRAQDHYDMTEKGIVEMAWVSTGYQAGRMLISNAAQLPFVVGNADGGSMAFDEWYRPYAAKDMPGVKMCLMHMHDVATLHSKKEIRHPEQIKGMKIRPAHATMAQWMTSLGATTVQVSAPESREALERGVADAITFPWNSIYQFKIDGITKFHIDAPMYVATFAIMINQAKYDALPAAAKKAIDGKCTTEQAGYIGREWARWEDIGRQKMKASGSGHTIVSLKPDEIAAWKASAAPVVRQWGDEMRKAGHDPDKVLGDLKKTLGKYKAQAI